MNVIRTFFLSLITAALFAGSVFAQQNGSISGQVVDSFGAIVVGATVTAVTMDGAEKQVVSNAQGQYSITGLAPGQYIVRAAAAKFAPFEDLEVTVESGKKTELNISMIVGGVEETVNVNQGNTVSTDPSSNAGATVLKDADLDALPDDPDELESALQALAGSAAGPNGGQIYIDGFQGGQLPPKEAIREIRINQNPFSAEYDRLGFGRIEILTRPGSDKFRGSVNGRFNDESLNSRNPFALNRAPSQTKDFGGNISGPIKKGKASYFLSVNQRDIDNNAVVNATLLNSAFNIVPFNKEYQVPSKRFSFDPRIDFAINQNHTLVFRYSYDWAKAENQSIGDTSLASTATTSKSTGHEIRITETSILNPKTVNETRFSYNFGDRDQSGDNSLPTINVPSAFRGGGSQVGDSYTKTKTLEVSNFTTTSFGKNSEHSFKFGGRLRYVNINDRSENNYGGTFTFPGFFGTGVYDIDGDGVISSIEQYRAKVMGATDPSFNPTQFTLTTGDPLASINQTDVGVFAQDDWRISPAFMLSLGLRYENQTNISSNFNLAPRIGFAWSPGAGGASAPKTVIRGGVGVFYDRFGENYSLTALRFDGMHQLNLTVSANETDPVRRAAAILLLSQPVFTLNGVFNVPTASQILSALPQSNTIRTISDTLEAPYTMQAALGVERQLPWKTTGSIYYMASRSLHQLRTVNINAPICPLQVNCIGALRPDPTGGNVYQYESSGTINSNRIMANFRTTLSNRFSLFGNYSLGFSNGDTDGAGTFPAYSYNFDGEYGRNSSDIRHNFIIGGNITLPWSVTFNPFIMANSGRPFNITTGVDSNGDFLLTERPTFAQLASRCAELGLTSSFCDVSGYDPNAKIPRYFGQGPKYFSVNLRLGKNFGFGKSQSRGTQSGGSTSGGGNRGGGGMMGGPGGGGPRGGGGPGGWFGGSSERKPYNLNVSINVNNLFNKVNYGLPVGNLSSIRFGESTSTSGGFGGFGPGGGGSANRRVELQMRFSW